MYRPILVVLLSGVILCCVRTGAAQDDVERISDAVLLKLLPYINDIKDDLSCVKNDLTDLNKTVSHLSGDLEDYKQKRESELVGLQNMFNVSLTSPTEQLSHLNCKMDILDARIDTLDSKLDSVNISMGNQLMNLDQNLQMNFMEKLNNLPVYICGGTGGWRRVVYMDMTDPNTNCPSGWQLTSHSKRTCGKDRTVGLTCDSVIFSVSGGDYTAVCGRIKGYQDSSTDAFEAYDDGVVTTIDGAYVTGLSLTHGSPRQHIWTFAAGASEAHPTRDDVCPCDATTNITIPPFVGEDYFCESGRNSRSYRRFHSDDPLWDGDGCTSTSTCCSFNNPPYFTKQLPNSTTDDIEARICRWESFEDTPIELIELYVQ